MLASVRTLVLCLPGTVAIFLSASSSHNSSSVLGNVPLRLWAQAALLRTTLRHMESHSEDPHAVAQDCGTLGGAAYHGGKEMQDLAVEAGAIQACIGALQNFVDSPEVVKQCGSGLGGIIVFNHDACAVSAAAGGIDAIGAGIRAHPTNRDVMMTIDVFSSHCDLNPENRPKVREAGGIDLIFDSMKRFYRDGEVQYKNWAGLSATSDDRGNQEAIAKGPGWCPTGCGTGQYQGIELLVQTMRDLRPAYRVNQEAIQVAKSLCSHSAEYRDALVAAGLVEEVVRTVRERGSEELGTPCAGAEVLGMLADANEMHRARIADTHIVADILSAMQARIVPDQTQYGGITQAEVWPMLPSGCKFLKVMAQDEESKLSMRRNSSAIKMLTTVASSGEPSARLACALTLWSLSS